MIWKVSPREGYADDGVRHALHCSQEPGVWANPRNPQAGGAEDGQSVAGGVYSYATAFLENEVATKVFVRSFTGDEYSERSQDSSK